MHSNPRKRKFATSLSFLRVLARNMYLTSLTHIDIEKSTVRKKSWLDLFVVKFPFQRCLFPSLMTVALDTRPRRTPAVTFWQSKKSPFCAILRVFFGICSEFLHFPEVWFSGHTKANLRPTECRRPRVESSTGSNGICSSLVLCKFDENHPDPTCPGGWDRVIPHSMATVIG